MSDSRIAMEDIPLPYMDLFPSLLALAFVPYCILCEPLSMMSLYKSDKFSTRVLDMEYCTMRSITESVQEPHFDCVCVYIVYSAIVKI